jgi:hypothetical protein
MNEEMMTEQNEINETQKYIDTINDLKRNSVSRSEYDKIRNENKTLLESIVNGKTFDTSSAEEEVKPSIDDLRQKAYGPGCEKLTDLEYVTAVCDLRDALLEETGIDYMAPTGSQYNADFNDKATANKLYEGFRHCIDIADGDNLIFVQEMNRITNDAGIINKVRNRR